MATHWSEELLHTSNGAEEGHVAPAMAGVLAAAGVIALGIGAANDTGWLAVAGGITAGVGILAVVLGEHMGVDYGILGRLEKLEGEEQSEE